MWAETKRVPLVARLKAEIEIHSNVMKEQGLEKDSTLVANLEQLQRKIQKRMEDTRYHVTLQHIGSAEDPRKWHRMNAAYNKQLHDIRVRAHKQVAGYGVPVEDREKAIDAEVARDVEFSDAIAKRARDVIVAGVVNGESEYTRLWQLGGDSLLLDALAEVRTFHEVDAELGEG